METVREFASRTSDSAASGPDWITVSLTAVLVAVTAYYAWQTYQIVQEMRRARGAQVMPRVAASLRILGVDLVMPRVVNVGPGPALTVDLQIGFGPGGPGQHVRRWTTPVMAPGQAHDFLPPPDPAKGGGPMDVTALSATYGTVRVTGAYRDALGTEFSVDDEIDIAAWWPLLLAADERVPDDWDEDTAKALEKMSKSLVDIAGVLKGAAHKTQAQARAIPAPRQSSATPKPQPAARKQRTRPAGGARKGGTTPKKS